MFTNGYKRKGSARPNAKLTEEMVLTLKTRMRDGSRNKDLAEEYGLHINTLSKIRNGYLWKHVKLES